MTDTREALKQALLQITIEGPGRAVEIATKALSAANAEKKVRTMEKWSQWKSGNEFLPFHSMASHVSPSYRDGWNACYQAALNQPAANAAEAKQETINYDINGNALPASGKWVRCTPGLLEAGVDCSKTPRRAGDGYSHDHFIAHTSLPSPMDAQPTTCGNCNGTGWMVRDPDIGTDQECFACDGTGKFEDDAPTPAAQPTEQADGFAEMRKALQEIDHIVQAFHEGGYGENGNRKAYRRVTELAQTWLKYPKSAAPVAQDMPVSELEQKLNADLAAAHPNSEFAKRHTSRSASADMSKSCTHPENVYKNQGNLNMSSASGVVDEQPWQRIDMANEAKRIAKANIADELVTVALCDLIDRLSTSINQAAQVETDAGLPPLPNPIGEIVGRRHTPEGTAEFWGYFDASYSGTQKERAYTEDQMRQYAREAIAANQGKDK